MAVASLKDVAAIVVVKGFQPDEATLAQSNEEGIPVLGTDMEAFEVSGRITSYNVCYTKLLRSETVMQCLSEYFQVNQ